MSIAEASKRITTIIELSSDKRAGAGIEIHRSTYPPPGLPWRITFFGDHFEAMRELSREDLEAIRDGINEALEDE